MISVEDAFSAEEVDPVRKIAGSLLASWKKDANANSRGFTIGASSIGGSHHIGGLNSVLIANPANYFYFDESDYLMNMAWERKLNQPIGGITKAMAEAMLDNTSGRFLPDYAGGDSELFTAMLPRRPIVINAGFNYSGTDHLIPQFSGITTKTPKLDSRNKTMQIQAADYIDFFQNKYLDETTMFTATRSDVVLETLFNQLEMTTAQYDLDVGLNTIGFGLFETGTKFGDIINEIVQAEYGHFYQDEEGVFRFENRQHWSRYPHFNVQRVITTAMVINAEVPSDHNIINVVEVKASPREVSHEQEIFDLQGFAGGGAVELLPGQNKDVWANYDDPVFSVTTPTSTVVTGVSYYRCNTLQDASGTDVSDSVTLRRIDNFAQASKLVFHNNTSSTVFLTSLVIYGRPARKTGDIYYREQADASVTAYEERPLIVENKYIQDADWARSFAQLILEDYKNPESLQRLTVRAIPELQLGDLVSWQGRYWRVYGIKTTLDSSVGFVQELELLQRTIRTYFEIGVSSVGGTHQIAP